MTWVRTASGWRHRPWWKVAINSVLRTMQPTARNKWVVYTVSTVPDDPKEEPEALTYGIGPVPHYPEVVDDG